MGKNIEIKIEPNEKGLPLCPHCKSELAQVDDYLNTVSKRHFLHNLHMIVCPKCRKVLGASIIGK